MGGGIAHTIKTREQEKTKKKEHWILSTDIKEELRLAERKERTVTKKSAVWHISEKGPRTGGNWLLSLGSSSSQAKESKTDCQRLEVQDSRRVQKFRKIKEDYHLRFCEPEKKRNDRALGVVG